MINALEATLVATNVATACNASRAGVVVSVSFTSSSFEYVVWARTPAGQITEHRLDVANTTERRLAAHVAGFVANHVAAHVPAHLAA